MNQGLFIIISHVELRKLRISYLATVSVLISGRIRIRVQIIPILKYKFLTTSLFSHSLKDTNNISGIIETFSFILPRLFHIQEIIVKIPPIIWFFWKLNVEAKMKKRAISNNEPRKNKYPGNLHGDSSTLNAGVCP